MSVAIVTGGSRGIGAATVPLLAAAGHHVVFSYRADADAAASVVECGADLDVEVRAVRADVAVESDVLAMFAEADDLGPLAVLVNNAGIVDTSARLDTFSVDRLERMFRINVTGAFVCAREAVRRMSTEHGGSGGSIVNVGSVVSRTGGPGVYVDYAASKGAIDTMTLGLAQEVAGEGIRVNCVRPGLTDTDIHHDTGVTDRIAKLGPTVPMGRAATPGEVAAAIAWLCSPDASYVTGALLDVTGGR